MRILYISYFIFYIYCLIFYNLYFIFYISCFILHTAYFIIDSFYIEKMKLQLRMEAGGGLGPL